MLAGSFLENISVKNPVLLFAAGVLAGAALICSGCGGGSSDSGTTVSPAVDPTLPTVSVQGGYAVLPNRSRTTTSVKFVITLSTQPNGVATIMADSVNGTAFAGSDFERVKNLTLQFNPGETSKTLFVPVITGTPYPQPVTKTFGLLLKNPSANIALGTALAIGTIMFSPSLDDTGIAACATDAATGLDCVSAAAGTDQYPVQDAQAGFDVLTAAKLLTKIGGGDAGFDFTKLDSFGNPRSDQNGVFTTSPWPCVRDNYTGLVWEVKGQAGAGNLEDAGNTYTWYTSKVGNNGGSPGVQDGGSCSASACDTESYVAAVNALNLCGSNTWRLPTAVELQTIVDYGKGNAPTVDTNYFPNTRTDTWYWTSAPYAPQSGYVWGVDFSNGLVKAGSNTSGAAVRLVHN